MASPHWDSFGLVLLILLLLNLSFAAQADIYLNPYGSPWTGDCGDAACADPFVGCSLPADHFITLTGDSDGECHMHFIDIHSVGKSINASSLPGELWITLHSNINFPGLTIHTSNSVHFDASPSSMVEPSISIDGGMTISANLAEGSFNSGAPIVTIANLILRGSFIIYSANPTAKRDLSEFSLSDSQIAPPSSATVLASSSKRQSTSFPFSVSVQRCTLLGERGPNDHTFMIAVEDMDVTEIVVDLNHVHFTSVTPAAPPLSSIIHSGTLKPLRLYARNVSTSNTVSAFSRLVNADAAHYIHMHFTSSHLAFNASHLSASNSNFTLVLEDSSIWSTTFGHPIFGKSLVLGTPLPSNWQLQLTSSEIRGYDLTNATISLIESDLINVLYTSPAPPYATMIVSSSSSTSTSSIILDQRSLPLLPDHGEDFVSLDDASIFLQPGATLLLNTTFPHHIGIHGTSRFIYNNSGVHDGINDCNVLVLGTLTMDSSSSLTSSCELHLRGDVTSGSINGWGLESEERGPHVYPSLHLWSSYTYSFELNISTIAGLITFLDSSMHLSESNPLLGALKVVGSNTNFGVIWPPSVPLDVPSAKWLLLNMPELEDPSLYTDMPAYTSGLETKNFIFKLQLHQWMKKRNTHQAPPVTGVWFQELLTPTTPSSTRSCGQPPTTGTYACINGTWYSSSSVSTSSSLTIATPVVIIGNLTASTIIFTNIDSSLIVDGCINVTSETTTIDLTKGIGKKTSGSLTIQQNPACPISLLGLGVNVKNSKSECKKVRSRIDPKSTPQSLTVLFSVDSSACDTKWIILGAVLGAVIVLGTVGIVITCVILKKRKSDAAFKAIRG